MAVSAARSRLGAILIVIAFIMLAHSALSMKQCEFQPLIFFTIFQVSQMVFFLFFRSPRVCSFARVRRGLYFSSIRCTSYILSIIFQKFSFFQCTKLLQITFEVFAALAVCFVGFACRFQAPQDIVASVEANTKYPYSCISTQFSLYI
jgi:hypothetical protein